MCGIVGIVGTRPVRSRLLRGLRRLEYRGYDSAGLAIHTVGGLERRRAAGKIANLEAIVDDASFDGVTGIAHTRWATHGAPTEDNAHPHTSGPVSLVHNGIIENFQALRDDLIARGRVFESETDTETIAHLLATEVEAGASPADAMAAVLPRLEGAFALAALFDNHDGMVIAARKGAPLVIGYGNGEMFLGSDAIALASLAREIAYLEEGDWAVLTPESATIRDATGAVVDRDRVRNAVDPAMAEKGNYPHFMIKEIHEQPETISRSLLPYVDTQTSLPRLPEDVAMLFSSADRAVSIACGTAHYAGMLAAYWFERLARLPLTTDIASEYRYRSPVMPQSGPAIFVSQSGETADTLAALRHCKDQGTPTLAVVNVPTSSIAREAAVIAPTAAGPEIGVASTKAFTAQLSVLAALAVGAGHARGTLSETEANQQIRALLAVPRQVSELLQRAGAIEEIARSLSTARTVLFLGRGVYYPVALEGALKLKEITYIHAEGYAAGELKHGPIALVEDGVPVVVVAPMDELFEKTVSNMEEVRARGASVTLISDAAGLAAAGAAADHSFEIPVGGPLSGAILASVAMQLMAYHCAVAKGTDVDQPRNLAKSVTVE
ncbi:MAG: glutamine--fructose-6-phosphate transaminase (isomerizing) [Pseudomonadota bacterium]